MMINCNYASRIQRAPVWMAANRRMQHSAYSAPVSPSTPQLIHHAALCSRNFNIQGHKPHALGVPQHQFAQGMYLISQLSDNQQTNSQLVTPAVKFSSIQDASLGASTNYILKMSPPPQHVQCNNSNNLLTSLNPIFLVPPTHSSPQVDTLLPHELPQTTGSGCQEANQISPSTDILINFSQSPPTSRLYHISQKGSLMCLSPNCIKW